MITKLEKPIIDKWRETRIEYVEHLGNADKSINIETFLTFDELLTFCRSVLGVDNDGA